MPKLNDENNFKISHLFNAPVDLVFDTWTEPNQLEHWIAPKGFAAKYVKADLRPGGVSHYYLITADGPKMWGKVVYRKVVRPTKLEYIQSFSNEAQDVTRHPASPSWPLEMLTTVTFEEINKQTKLTVVWSPINALPNEIAVFMNSLDGMTKGWTGSFEQLENYLISSF